MPSHPTLLIILALGAIPAVASEVEWELDPLVIGAGPEASIAFPEVFESERTSDYARPVGSLTQFRGLGRTADDTRVETLGVSLNPPQGGGFDLSSFPGFLWTRHRFSVAPSGGTYDPRATSGRLALDPWSAAAAAGRESRFRLTQEFSGPGILETSAAVSGGAEPGHPGLRGAAVAGFGAGEISAQAGAGAVRWVTGGGIHELHVLGARRRAPSPGSLAFPTPRAETESARVIPIIRSELQVGEELSLSTSVHGDLGTLRYGDPGSGFSTFDRFDRLGGGAALREGSGWTLGADFERASYTPGAVAPIEEMAASGRLSRRFGFAGGAAALEPSVRVAGVSGTGLLPEAAVSLSARPADGISVFSSAGFSRRHATLVDRYYVVPGFFRGNPALEPERDWTFLLGAEASRGIVSASLQGWLQLRDGVHLNVTDLSGPQPVTTVGNAGRAHVASLMHTVRVAPARAIELDSSVALARSRVERTGLSYPYLPGISHTVGATFRPGPPRGVQWELRGAARSSGRVVADDLGHELPGSTRIDLETAAVIPDIYDIKGKITLRLENVFDRPIATAWGYAPAGRTASLLLIGEI